MGAPGTDQRRNNPGRHPTRTLDQFFHSGLKNTQTRDESQTVSKWTGEAASTSDPMPEDGRPKASPESLVVMVDQLWIWVLDDSQ